MHSQRKLVYSDSFDQFDNLLDPAGTLSSPFTPNFQEVKITEDTSEQIAAHDDKAQPDSQTIVFRLLSTQQSKTFTLNLRDFFGSCLFIRDLKLKLSMHRDILPSVPPSRLKLLLQRQNRILQDNDLLSDVNFQDHDVVQILVKICDVTPIFDFYEDFIVSTSPRHLSVNVDVHAALTIAFGSNSAGRMIYMPSFTDPSRLPTLYSSGYRSGNTVVSNLRSGDRIDVEKKYKWTEAVYEQAVFLILVEESLDLHLESLRYSIDKGKGQYSGDKDSWQRYTAHLPVACRITTSSMLDGLPHMLTIEPAQPLLYNTQYAIILQHGIPTVPCKYPYENTLDFLSDGIGEDKVIIFRTEKFRAESDHFILSYAIR